MQLELDHIVVATTDLARGVAEIDLPWLPGGVHVDFGTHNRLLSLGSADYLELIAVNPDAPPLDKMRWYDMDQFEGPTRVQNWVLRTGDLEAALARFGDGFGVIHELSRGELRWRMAVPETGILPFDNCAPALIQWETPPPMPGLRDQGHRLVELVVSHPEAEDMAALFAGLSDGRVRFEVGAARIKATLSGPSGPVVLP
ncbi:MAG: VOC family protein [Pseudomonadota bacterium]